MSVCSIRLENHLPQHEESIPTRTKHDWFPEHEQQSLIRTAQIHFQDIKDNVQSELIMIDSVWINMTSPTSFLNASPCFHDNDTPARHHYLTKESPMSATVRWFTTNHNFWVVHMNCNTCIIMYTCDYTCMYSILYRSCSIHTQIVMIRIYIYICIIIIHICILHATCNCIHVFNVCL